MTGSSECGTVVAVREILIGCILVVDGKVVSDVLHVFVTEEQFKQYNTILRRDAL